MKSMVFIMIDFNFFNCDILLLMYIIMSFKKDFKSFNFLKKKVKALVILVFCVCFWVFNIIRFNSIYCTCFYNVLKACSCNYYYYFFKPWYNFWHWNMKIKHKLHMLWLLLLWLQLKILFSLMSIHFQIPHYFNRYII